MSVHSDKKNNMNDYIEILQKLKPGDVDVIGKDFIMVNNLTINDINAIKALLGSEISVIVICRSGAVDLRINMKSYTVESTSVVVTLPDQIVECLNISPNFEALAIGMSDRFIEMLNIGNRAMFKMSLRNNPVIALGPDSANVIKGYQYIISQSIRNSQNPYRLEVVENFTRAFFYAGGFYYYELSVKHSSTYQDSIVDRFIKLVRENYREQRRVGFYADKLCITPKYLSKVIKESSGQSAVEWIDSYVVLEARAMLKSSDKTIQQISVALNFPNQSFFGKYFKRMTGVSPKEYREGGGMGRRTAERVRGRS